MKTTTLDHSEFNAFQQRVRASFNAWRDVYESMLLNIKAGTSPKEIIHALSEGLLVCFADLPLLNPYDVYQRLMDYWDETMQDDVYLIAADGWLQAAQPRDVIEDKNRKITETPDLIIKRRKYKMDLIPPALIVAREFVAEQDVLETLQVEQEDAKCALEDFVEEHTGDEGLLLDVVNDKGNVTLAGVKARLNEITPNLVTPLDEENTDEEWNALECCISLLETKAKADKAVKDTQLALDTKVLDRYSTLTEAEIETLVVGDKWFGSIRASIEDEVQRLTQQLTGRVRELEERYAQPLPQLDSEVRALSAQVEEHLSKMGMELL